MSGLRDIAVVIPSWNSAALLPRCLDSIEGQEVEIELLVVDNGSADGSVELLAERGIPHLSLPRNIGFAAAINLGAARVAAPAVMVLNVDTALEPGALGSLLAGLDADPRLGGVQPRLLQMEDGSAGEPPGREIESARLYSAGQALTADGRALEEGAGKPQTPAYLRPHEIFGVCGAACLLRRELFSRLGGYDETYFAFYEDVDLNVRARVAGWRFGYVPEAVVWHLGNASWMAGFADPGADNARLVARNRLATQVKYVPLRRLPRIAATELGSLALAAWRRRFLPTLQGKLAALRWLPRLIAERRRLAADGDLAAARRWLGIRVGADQVAGQGDAEARR